MSKCTLADKQLIKKRFDRNAEDYDRKAVIQLHIALKLADLLLRFNIVHFNRALEIGYGTGFLTKKILSNFSVVEYMLNDISDIASEKIRGYCKDINFHNYRFIHGDAETTNFPMNIDAVLSSSTFQWFDDLEFFISKTQRLLNDTGIIAFSVFGEDNFKEIKTLLNLGLKYKTLNELKTIIKSGFDIIHAEEWIEVKQFHSPKDVLEHMKLTSVNSLQTFFFGKNRLLDFSKNYRRLFSNKDKMVNLTYHPIIIIAKKR